MVLSLTVVAVVTAGAFLGGFVRWRLPTHHLDGDTKVNQAFGGVIAISDAPLRAALAQLAR